MKPDIRLLSVDTSTNRLSLAVSRGAKIIAYKNTELGRHLSSSMIPSIERILKKSDMPIADIDGFAVGLGPGSFTSLRVGISTIKGMAFAFGKPVVGISSLDVLAMNVKEDHPMVCVIRDAKRNMVFACLFDKKGRGLKRLSDSMLLTMEELLKKIKGDVYFIGDGIGPYKEQILKAKGIVPRFADRRSWYPQARMLVPLALGRYKNEDIDDAAVLVPEYLYPEDCQVRQ